MAYGVRPEPISNAPKAPKCNSSTSAIQTKEFAAIRRLFQRGTNTGSALTTGGLYINVKEGGIKMNREERRHPQKVNNVRQMLKDFSTMMRIKQALEGDWQLQPGDKVQLHLEAIKTHPDYDRKSSKYKDFCENNADRIFTVEYNEGLKPSVVCLAEDESNPKWLFWIGDLKKVDE